MSVNADYPYKDSLEASDYLSGRAITTDSFNIYVSTSKYPLIEKVSSKVSDIREDTKRMSAAYNSLNADFPLFAPRIIDGEKLYLTSSNNYPIIIGRMTDSGYRTGVPLVRVSKGGSVDYMTSSRKIKKEVSDLITKAFLKQK